MAGRRTCVAVGSSTRLTTGPDGERWQRAVVGRGPGEGFWDEKNGQARDDIVVFNVRAEDLDKSWWRTRRGTLEREFQQDEILIRA